MNERKSCSSLLAPESPWTLSRRFSRDVVSNNRSCCSQIKRRDPAELQFKVSLPEDDSDTDTLSPKSNGSRASDEVDILDGECVIDDHGVHWSAPEQSPIDIREHQCGTVPWRDSVDRVTISMSSNAADLEYSGQGFSVRWASPSASTLRINDKVYKAVQFHFHTPSEHTLDGDHAAMELHLVHEAEDGGLAVVAVFFREGAPNAFLAQFWGEVSALKLGVEASVPLRVVDPTSLCLLSGPFFRYRGSLTTPPYTEGVEWIVVQDPAEASHGQLEAFRNVLPGPNARPIQPLHGRDVTLIQ